MTKIENCITKYTIGHQTNNYLNMLFRTQLELNITIKDINAMYATDYDQMLLDHAKLMYQGKCRDGQYVKSIDRLVKRSLPNLVRRDLDAKVRVYIVVEATAIRYDQYDIITGMKIKQIILAGKHANYDTIECRNDHVIAFLRIQKGVEQFKVGDSIPIRVGQSLYKIGNEQVLVNGYPFLPFLPDQVMYNVGKLSPETKAFFTSMVAPLFERELKRKETLNRARWEFFSKLIHPCKKETKAGAIDILNIDSIQNGTFGIDYSANMDAMKISSSNPKATEVVTIVSEEQKSAITRLTFPFIKWLEAVNDLTEQYDSDDELSKLDHVWKLYSDHKY